MACLSEAPEAIVFELKEPFRVIERLLSPSRDDRVYAGKCHPADMARSADVVQCPAASTSRRRMPATSARACADAINENGACVGRTAQLSNQTRRVELEENG